MGTNFRTRHVIAGALVMGTLSCSGPSSTDAAYNRTQAEADIKAIEHSWAQVAVSGDPAVIEQIFADDFVGIAPDGAHYTKRGFIDDTRAHPLGFAAIELNEMKVRFEGNVAVAHGSETFTRKDGDRGKFVWTDVLVRHDGKWQLVAAQDAMVPLAGGSSSSGLFADASPSAAGHEGIDKTRNAYVAAWRAADAGKVAALYSEDALVLYPNQPPVTGSKAIVDYFNGFFGEFPKNEFTLTSAEIEVVGPWAFDRGTYRWKGTPGTGGKAVEDNGKYLVILKRQPSGDWKVARDMDNSDRAASQVTRGTE